MIMECGNPLLEILNWVLYACGAAVCIVILGFAIACVIVIMQTAHSIKMEDRR